MSRFTGFSDKSFKKKNKLQYGRSMSSDTIALNFSTEVDSTGSSMVFGILMGFYFMGFLKWRQVNNSNSWFLAMLNGFSEGLPLFKIIFALKIRSILTKIDISYVILKSEN